MPDNLREVIAEVERIIRLVDVSDWQPHYEIALENYIFHPFDFGSQNKDAGRSRSGDETLGSQANSQAAVMVAPPRWRFA